MYLNDAVELVVYAFENAKAGDLFVQKSPAATIDNLSKAMLKIFNLTTDKLETIGTRNGEKLYMKSL